MLARPYRWSESTHRKSNEPWLAPNWRRYLMSYRVLSPLRDVIARRLTTPLLLAPVLFLALTEAGCLLTTESIYTRPVYTESICKATLVDTGTGERRLVNSSMLARTAPGAPARTFF